MSLSPAPSATALRLGYAGLLPFAGIAVLVWLLPPQARVYATLALGGYAATIVSFLGGIHWGIAFGAAQPPASLFVWGVLPSLAAWVALLLPAGTGLLLHAAMLLACYAVDRQVYPRHGLGHWLPLRLRLSSIAALTCLVGAAAP